MKAWEIVGYVYSADIWCVECMATKAVTIFRNAGGKVESISTESNLNSAALYMGIDRHDESSFDSDEFPKVIFASDATDEECTICGRAILDVL